jgi:hypothetical protein
MALYAALTLASQGNKLILHQIHQHLGAGVSVHHSGDMHLLPCLGRLGHKAVHGYLG